MTDARPRCSDGVRLGRYGGPALELDVEAVGARCRIRVRGELDLATAEQFAAALSAMPSEGHRVVLLDLAGLTFCDATGLSVLLAAHRAYQAVHGSLILTGYNGQLAKLLRVTGLDHVLLTQQQDNRATGPSIWWD